MSKVFLKRSSLVVFTGLLLVSIAAAPPRVRAADKEDQSIDMDDEQGSQDENPSSSSRLSDRGYLGVSVQRLRHSLKQAFDIPDEVEGLIINKVYDKSPADKAGLRDKDVITKFNGERIGSEDEFTRLIRRSRPGSEVALTVWRDGRVQEITATLGSAGKESNGWTVLRNYGNKDESVAPEAPNVPDVPDLDDVPGAPGPGETPEPPDVSGLPGLLRQFSVNDDRGHMGIYLQDLNKDIAEFFSARDERGAIVWQVIEDSPAQEAGLKAGDVITAIDGKQVQDSQDLREILAGYEAGQTVSVALTRRGEPKVVKVKLNEGNDGEFRFGNLGNMRFNRLHDVPGYRFDIFRDRQRNRGPDRSMQQLQREMDQLQQRMNRLKEDLERLKD